MRSTLLRIAARLRRFVRRLTGGKLRTRKPFPRDVPPSDLAERVRPPAGTLGEPPDRPHSPERPERRRPGS